MVHLCKSTSHNILLLIRRNDLAGAEGTGAFLRQQVLYVAVPDQRLCGAGHCPV